MAVRNLVAKLTLQGGQFKAGMKSARKLLRGLRGDASALETALAGLSLAGLAYAGKQAVEMAWDLGKLGAESMRLETALDDLARQAGGSADQMLSAIRRASGGTVSEMDAMQAANRGLLLGLGANAQQWEQLVEVARFRARAMGISMTQALGDITTAIGRESRMIADNLGIVWDMDRIMGEYAATLGKTSGELTQVERKAALMADTIRIGQEQIRAAGGIANDAADDFAKLTTAWDNLKVSAGKTVAQTSIVSDLTDAFDMLTLALDGGYVALVKEQRAMEQADLATRGWMVSLGGLPGYLRQVEGSLYSVMSIVDSYSGGIVGMVKNSVPDEAITGWKILQGEQARLRDEFIRNAVLRGQAEEKAADTAARAWTDSINQQQRAYEDLKSTIAGALSATSVTALDVGLSATGNYEDKWDENARRLMAIAQRGFAELQAHADWAEVLMIPPEVMQAGEAALKSWAAQTASDVQNLFRPDLINVDAAIAAVQESMADQAARESTLDMIAQAMGGVEGAQMTGQELGAYFGGGFSEALTATSPAGDFKKVFQDDLKREHENLVAAGEGAWKVINIGIFRAISSSHYLRELAAAVSPYVVRELQEAGIFSGGGGQP